MPASASLLDSLHAPTLLWLAVVVMVAAAAIMSLFGLTHRVYRGYRWWMLAMWLAALGGGLQMLRGVWPAAVVPGNLLLLVWPMLIVTGLRRFFSRGPLSGSSTTDALVFVGAYLLWFVTWALPELQSWRTYAYSTAMMLLHLYAAAFVLVLPELRRSPSLRTLFCVMLAQAVLPILRLSWHLATDTPVQSALTLLSPMVIVATLVAMLFAVYLCLALTHERTETDLKESQRQLRVLADIDMLTQVPNRRHFEELAAAALTQSSQARAVVMLFDIDHFKAINDSRGHAVGDVALKRVARSARDTLRSRDVLGRLGGDEFIALLPGASVDDALHAAERIARRLEQECSQNGDLHLGLSFGVVKIESGESLESAQHRADLALYEAKRQGRRRAVPATREGGDTVFGESRRLGLNGES
ncbi:GGDEF domain-containing protein [Rivibacter subsaxonicus]|uniref:diguanylate cyclase n=1 Tax=Rivibacter subsaxonicus TaxID=457575 RepID=A0A4Q7W0H3_9BURK|nr:GGDEF domain-containing protein [Rivibacter subsaxonicus]RZU02681.1 diguanylate cyclase (GGDEF)-like protein [Rivibacter subsaxonicus]